jgi:hypothetical protein
MEHQFFQGHKQSKVGKQCTIWHCMLNQYPKISQAPRVHATALLIIIIIIIIGSDHAALPTQRQNFYNSWIV